MDNTIGSIRETRQVADENKCFEHSRHGEIICRPGFHYVDENQMNEFEDPLFDAMIAELEAKNLDDARSSVVLIA